jgi:hypothetical protein
LAAERKSPEERAPARGFVFTRALGATLRRPTIWAFVWLVSALLAAAATYPVHGFYKEAIGQSYAPGSMVYELGSSLGTPAADTTFRTDHATGLETLHGIVSRVGFVVAFLSILWGVFAAGGWLQVVLDRARTHSLRRFVFGGARYFWRFFRLMILSCLIIGVFGWALYDWPWQQYVLRREYNVPSFDLQALETLESEADYVRLRSIQDGLFALVFALTLCWAEYTRTRLALHDTSSVIGAGLRTFFTLLLHPIRSLRPLLLLLLLEAGLLWLAARTGRWLEAGLAEDPSWTRWAFFALVAQLAVLWRIVTDGARYHATAAVSREVVRPLSRPDPWKSSIGGPGGPRYPLEGADEYGVSL